MMVEIVAVAMPWETSTDAKGRTVRSRPVKTFAYTRCEADGERADDSVLSANHALQIVRRICGDAIAEGEPPKGEGHTPLFTVQLQVTDTHRRTSSYRAAYRKLDGRTPLAVIGMMMDIYHAIKRTLRSARDDLRRERDLRAGRTTTGRRDKTAKG